MTRSLLHSFLPIAACVLGLALSGMPSTATAQFVEADVSTCNLAGVVRITIGNLPATRLALACVNRTERRSTGTSNGPLDNTSFSLGSPPVVSIGNLQATSKWTNVLSVDSYEGQTTSNGIELLDGYIRAIGVFQGFRCKGTPAATCDVTAGVDTLVIGDSVIPLPDPIPVNYTVPLANVPFSVTVLGIPVNIPLNGALTLNKVDRDTSAATVRMEHGSFSLSLSGGAGVGLAGNVTVQVRIEDFSLWSKLTNPPINTIAINNLTPEAWIMAGL